MRAEVNRCSIVCNPKVLAGKSQTANATEVRLALAVAVPSRLFAWVWRLIQRAVYLALHAHSGSRLAAISPLEFA